MSLSKRAQQLLSEHPPHAVSFERCATDPWHPTNNPNGYINLGTAENMLIEPVILQRVRACRPADAASLHYSEKNGTYALRKSLAQFCERFLSLKMAPEHMAAASGSSAILEMLSLALCDAGDKVLVPAPYYTGFLHDLQGRFHGVVVGVDLFTKDGFDMGGLEQAFIKHQPKVFLLNSPHNPTGYCFSDAELRGMVELCKKHKIEIITDEIYANSVYQGKAFRSLLHFADGYEQHIHWVYGIAKDFGLSGFKVGFFYSANKQVAEAVQAQCYFHTLAGNVQGMIAEIFQDFAFCEKLFQTSHTLILQQRRKMEAFAKEFDFEIFPSESGLFSYMRMCKLEPGDLAGELAFFQKIFTTAKVNITPAQYFGSARSGWFRIIHALPEDRTQAGLARLRQYFKSL